MDQRCGTCGARTSARAGWCSLCLTPLGPRPAPAAAPVPQHEVTAPVPQHEVTAAGRRSRSPGVEMLLAELDAQERLGDLSHSRLGPFLQLRRGTRFVIALGASALVAGVGCLVVALVAAVAG